MNSNRSTANVDPSSAAEKFFRRGLDRLSVGRTEEAADLFRSAIEAEEIHCAIRPRQQYRSYYGLSLALSRGVTPEALHLCEEAVHNELFDPEVIVNLARVYLRAGMLTRALHTIEMGLRRHPEDRRLRGLLAQYDRRHRPFLPMLGRDHPINRKLGLWRAPKRA